MSKILPVFFQICTTKAPSLNGWGDVIPEDERSFRSRILTTIDEAVALLYSLRESDPESTHIVSVLCPPRYEGYEISDELLRTPGLCITVEV